MRMAWESPTEPGFYYYRHKWAAREHIWVAQVSRTRASGLHATVLASLEQHRVEHRPVSELHGEWYGPLPKPEDYGA